MAFIKYVGGKSRVYDQLIEYFPEECHVYVEPFVGSGSVALTRKYPRAILSDNNPNLMSCYIAIRDNLELLISLLKEEQENFDEIMDDRIQYKERYLSIRELYNKNKLKEIEDFATADLRTLTGVAALYMVLNKTCFNGMYRESLKEGKFNVPPGSFKSVTILDESVLRSMHDYLNSCDVDIRCQSVFDLLESLKTEEPGGFIYCDPPFMINGTSKYISYTSKRFINEDHERLAEMLWDLKSHGFESAVSNSYGDNVLECYNRFSYVIINVSRSISQKTTARSKTQEVLLLTETESDEELE